MKILVTGHEGFIGSNILKFLKAQGHEVDGWEWKFNSMPDTRGYNWCIHLGAISSTTYTDVYQILKQNYQFSVDLLQLCKKSNTNFQYASSASVYGTTTHFTEDGYLSPQSPYAWSKYLFDQYVSKTINTCNIIIQGFRYFNVYGPGEEHKGNMASPYTKFMNQAKYDGVISLFENSNNYKRDFVCVEDVCMLHTKMFNSTFSNIYNVGTGTATSFEDVAQTIIKKYNAKIRYITIPAEVKNQYQAYTCANLDKLSSTVDMNWTTITDYINDRNY